MEGLIELAIGSELLGRLVSEVVVAGLGFGRSGGGQE